jgi:hypothetical protein
LNLVEIQKSHYIQQPELVVKNRSSKRRFNNCIRVMSQTSRIRAGIEGLFAARRRLAPVSITSGLPRDSGA